MNFSKPVVLTLTLFLSISHSQLFAQEAVESNRTLAKQGTVAQAKKLVVKIQNLLDKQWKANTVLRDARSYTVKGLGACQGVNVINNKLYFYGDRYDVSPRTGVIREYDLQMKSTGRSVLLNKVGKPVMTHPTGIAFLDRHNVFIGDTVDQKAKIYWINWEKAWKTGNLDHAIRAVIEDDLAVNGCRPLLVSNNGKRYIATADYGDTGNRLRLYDPQKLSQAKKTSDDGVLVAKIGCGKFNQNLDWHAESGQIVFIQNVIAGLGWQLQYIDLNRALKNSNTLGRGTIKRQLVFPAHTELEGFRVLPDGRMIFVTAHKEKNVWIGKPLQIVGKMSQPGYELPFFDK